MQASPWEFKNRALVFGLIFGLSFATYALDQQNATAALANWLDHLLGVDAAILARALFGLAACLVAIAALMRTWASSYLHAAVVYAAGVKTEHLVADGPYRRVRNPLYFANVLMAIGLGAMMSRIGFFVCVILMLIFCYRLIFLEESQFQQRDTDQYFRYRSAVPRLWPSVHPRVTASAARPRWSDGFKAEFWCWGCAAAVAAFAITLNNAAFFGILAASIALLWFWTRRSNQPHP